MIEILEKSEVLKKEQLEKALSIQKDKGGSLGKILVEQGFMDHQDLMVLVSHQLNIPPIDLSKYKINPEVIELIPEKIVRQYKLVPISKLGNTLTVAMSDPTNIIAMDDIKTLTNYTIDLVISTDADIENAISNYYGVSKESDISQIIQEGEKLGEELEVIEEEEKIDISEISAETKKAPIVKVVSMILNEALNKRASDVHIEPQEASLRVRYRVDGNLQEALNIPKKNQNAIIARLKIMSGLDITETRLPQDGRFKIKFKDREVDFRVSVLPVSFGNKVVLRALDRSSLSIGLDRMGFLPEPLAVFKKALKRPYGMILITGPTGSGKSTTLYSILNQLNTPEKNIVTIEDPVEYQLEGITQVQVIPDIGLTFANGLKSILRQSPDIVMVGEIRDFETADIAIKASLTGQIVLSTLHTNDAPSAITRLIDMGVKPFLVASSIQAIMAQRLVRVICKKCKTIDENPDMDQIESLGITPEQMKKNPPQKGAGCSQCQNSGYKGRIAIFEMFEMNNEIRELAFSKAPTTELRKAARASGMRTLMQDGMLKIFKGTTTPAEIVRITQTEDATAS